MPKGQVAGAGFEQPVSNTGKTAISDSGDVKSDDISSNPAGLADALKALASLSPEERETLRKLLE